MKAPKRHPEKLSTTLEALLKKLDPDGRFDIARLIRLWPELVGPDIARRTEVGDLKFHTAVIRSSSAMWIQELNLLKPQILAKLCEQMGDDSVRDIRFVRGALSRRSHPRPRAVRREIRSAIKLPEIKDPELKRAIESLIESWGRASR